MKNTLYFLLLIIPLSVYGQRDNKPESVERFMDMGFGMFIHWSLDSQLVAVISHCMAGASDDYLERFTTQLSKKAIWRELNSAWQKTHKRYIINKIRVFFASIFVSGLTF